MRLIVATLAAALASGALAFPRSSRYPDLTARQNVQAVSAFGNCTDECGIISTINDACGSQDMDRCKTVCDDASLSALSGCQTCISDLDSGAAQSAASTVSQWVTYMSDTCPIINNPDPVVTPKPEITPKPDNPITTRPCSECDSLNPVVMIACNTSNPNTCRGLCSNLDLMHSCVDCYNKAAPGSFGEFESYVKDADWYCSTDGGKACSATIDAVGELCTENSDKCKDMCAGDRWDNIKKCKDQVGSSGLTGSQIPIIQDGLKDFDAYCQGGTVKPEGCAKECDSILSKYTDLCGGKDAKKCRGMCSNENLGAFVDCNTCAWSNKSVYSLPTQQSIGSSLSVLQNWCKTAETKPVTDPEVVSTVPDPTNIKDTVKTEDETAVTNPSPIKNPFGSSDSKSSSNSSSKGFPTWGIGAAVGGAVAVLAVAGSVLACNYQCDHERHRLKRRRRKNKKKQEDEEPRPIGYIYPVAPAASQPGYFPPSSTSPPLSPPVSMAHTPMGPPTDQYNPAWGPGSPPLDPHRLSAGPAYAPNTNRYSGTGY